MSTKTKHNAGDAAERLAKLQARRDELNGRLPDLRAALEAAQSDLIDGKKGAEQSVTDAQARLAGTEGALELLEQKITEAEAAVDEIERVTAVKGYKRELVESVTAAEEAVERDAAAHQRFREAFEAFINEVTAARRAWVGARDNYARLRQAAEDAGESAGELDEHLRSEGVSPRTLAGAFPQEYELGTHRGPIVQARNMALNLRQAA